MLVAALLREHEIRQKDAIAGYRSLISELGLSASARARIPLIGDADGEEEGSTLSKLRARAKKARQRTA